MISRPSHELSVTSHSAFSLIELLVAVAVATIVGATAMALILHSFGVWEEGMARTGVLQATDEFDLDFSRDFASAYSALGLKGCNDSCVFWTLRRTPGDIALCRVRYAFDKDGALAERWEMGSDTNAPGLTTRYRTTAFSAFSYAGTNVADNVWQPSWDCSTGMPSVISVKCDLRSSTPSTPSTLHPFNPSGRRLYLRRTTP
jgi:prepilin-type N-terminal cleavage/methylation domain-containing protein